MCGEWCSGTGWANETGIMGVSSGNELWLYPSPDPTLSLPQDPRRGPICPGGPAGTHTAPGWFRHEARAEVLSAACTSLPTEPGVCPGPGPHCHCPEIPESPLRLARAAHAARQMGCGRSQAGSCIQGQVQDLGAETVWSQGWPTPALSPAAPSPSPGGMGSPMWHHRVGRVLAKIGQSSLSPNRSPCPMA